MANILLVLCLLAFADFSIEVVQGHKVNTESKMTEKDYSVHAPGDVMIAGLFPVHLERVDSSRECVNLQHDALVWTEAMIFAIEEINKNSTLLPNITLGYQIFDSCGNIRTAMEWAADFVFHNALKFDPKFKVANECSSVASANATSPEFSPPIVSVIGSDFSEVSINIANMLQLKDIPQVSYASTSSELSDTTKYTSFFRTVPADNLQSKAMADLIAHNKWSCVAILGVDDHYGRSGVDSFLEEAAKRNICIALSELFPATESELTIKEIMSKLREKPQIGIFILYCLAPDAVKVLDEALKQNLTGKTWIASEGWTESSYVKTEKYLPIIHGSVGFVLKEVDVPGLETHLQGLNSSIRNAAWWNDLWREQYRCDVSESKNNLSSTRCTGKEKIPESIYRNHLVTRKAAYVKDAVHAVAVALDSILNCPSREAMQSPLECTTSARGLYPKQVLQALRNTSFRGLTGFLDFKNQNKVIAAYDLVNFQKANDGKVKFVTVGTWAERESPRLHTNDSQIQWCDGIKPRASCGQICRPGTRQSSTIQCLWECISCTGNSASFDNGSPSCTVCPKGYIANTNHSNCLEIPLLYIKWQDTWGIALTTISCVCIVATLAILVLTVKHYKAPIMKDTGLYLNLLLLTEVLFSYVLNFLLVSKPSDLVCRILPVYFYLIYTSAASTLLLKTLRIWRMLVKPIENQRKLAVLKSWRLYVIGVFTTLCPVVISVIWISTTPPTFEKLVESETYVYATCENTTAGFAFRMTCVFYLILLCILATIVAYNTKNLPHLQEFHEAKHLAYALTVFTLTFFTFYPGWYFIKGPILTVFACVTNMVAATGTLLCAYVPKLVVIFRETRLNQTIHVRPAPRVRPRRATTAEHIGSVGELYFSRSSSPSSQVRSRAQSRLSQVNDSCASSPDGPSRRTKRKTVTISTNLDSSIDSRL